MTFVGIISVIRWGVKRSPWILHFNTGACNGCDIEVLAAITPFYDPERYGVKLSPSPRHADIIVVTGLVTRKAAERLKRIYEQIPEPKVVVAIGTCAISGGVFQGSYAHHGGVDRVIPVDVYIPGCPPRPDAILKGLLEAVEVLEEKAKIVERTATPTTYRTSVAATNGG